MRWRDSHKKSGKFAAFLCLKIFWLPPFIGIEPGHRFGFARGLFAEIRLPHLVLLVHDKSRNAGFTVFNRPGN